MKLRVRCPKCGSSMSHPEDIHEMAVLPNEKVPFVCEVCLLETEVTLIHQVK